MNWITTLETAINDQSGYYGYGMSGNVELTELSRNWPTCACGELCRALPRAKTASGSDAPADMPLQFLGQHFYACVNRALYFKALDIFRRIESRTTFLLTGEPDPHADSLPVFHRREPEPAPVVHVVEEVNVVEETVVEWQDQPQPETELVPA